MKKIIKEQLEKITATKVQYGDNTTKIFIPRTTEIVAATLKVGGVYLIELKEFITNPTSASTLASNWNGGKIPKNKVYNIEVIQKMSNMFKVNGVAIDDPSDNIYLWLPEEGFTIIKEVK